MSNVKKQVLLCLAALMLAVLTVLTGIFPVGAVRCHAATAESSENNFDHTSVNADLADMDLTEFVYDTAGSIQFVTFVEYCYSANALNFGNYALYVYIYNPARIPISERQDANSVEMAVGYDEEGKPNDYANIPLKLCGISTGELSKLIYKFRVMDDGTLLRNARTQETDNGYRRYDIAGVQLWETGKDNAVDYGVGGTYKFTGYAKGYGTDGNAESNLLCTVEELETVELDVKHTFYRTQTSSKGAHYQNQLDTVYFAVPKRFFDTYGTLQRIKAEWYEYKTKDIVVTSNQDFYDKAYPWLGKQTGEFDQFGMTVYNEDIGISLGQNAGDAGGGMQMAAWGWNLGSGYLHVPAPALYYLFKVDDIEAYDPYADIVSIGGVESNALYEYIKNYDKSYDGGTLPIKDGTISADLFADDIDDYRKLDTEFGKIQQGYSYYDFDADVDLQTLSSWKETDPSFWDNWVNWGLWDTIFGGIPEEESKTVSPIYIVQESDLDGNDNEVADRLLINANDVQALRDYFKDATTVSGKDDEKKQVVLFRFATTDYYSAAVDIMELRTILPDKHTSGQAYRAWESVFFDFDIIQLTFNRDGVYTVIPVVSSPMDIVNAITPPVQMPSEWEWWQILLAIVLIVLLIIILFPILPYILKFLFWLICLPFRAIAALFRGIDNRRKKKAETKVQKEPVVKQAQKPPDDAGGLEV